MHYRRKLRKSKYYTPLRGLRLARKKKFEPELATASGIKVRSEYEKKCADYLFSAHIKFRYEPLMLLGGKKYRPDFYLPEYDLFLEICGYGHMPFYKDRIAFKQEIYEKNNLSVIFVNYRGKGSLENILREKLEARGVIHTPREEI
jgi:DNA helicase-4